MESIRFVSFRFVFLGAERRLNVRHHRVQREIEKFGALLCWIGSSVSSLDAFVHGVISLAEVHALSISSTSWGSPGWQAWPIFLPRIED